MTFVLADHAAALFRRALRDDEALNEGDDLRVELVRHGLRSERDAIAGLEPLKGWTRLKATERLIPVLGESGFDQLLEASRSGAGWPLGAICARLCDRAAWDQAFARITVPSSSSSQLGEVIARFPEPWRGRLMDALVAWPYPSDEETREHHLIEERIRRAAHLDPVRQREHLDRADAELSAIDLATLHWDSWEGSTDPRLDLARALTKLGSIDRAASWLSRVAKRPFPWVASGTLPDRDWAETLVELVKASGDLPRELRPDLLAALQIRPDPLLEANDFQRHVILLGALPVVEREQLLIEALHLARARPDKTEYSRALAYLSRGEGLPPEQAAHLWTQTVVRLARGDQTYQSQYQLSQCVLPTLREMAPLVPADQLTELASALCDWVATQGGLSHGGMRLANPNALNQLWHLLRRDRTLAARTLERWAALPEARVWCVHGWEDVLPEDVRRERLRRVLAERPRLIEPALWITRLLPLARALPEPQRTALFRAALPVARAAGAQPFASWTASAPASLQPQLCTELLELAPTEVVARNHVLREVVPHLASPELREQVCRRMCEIAEGQRLNDSPYWLEGPSKNLPAEEWESILRGILSAGKLPQAALYKSFLPARLKREQRESTRPPPEKVLEFAQWLQWQGSELEEQERRPLLTQLLARVTPTDESPDEHELTQAGTVSWRAFVTAIQLSSAADLASFQDVIVSRGASVVAEYAARTCLRDRDHVQLRRYLPRLNAWSRLHFELQLDAGQPLAPLFLGMEGPVFHYDWVIKAVLEQGRAPELARLARGQSPSDRLAVWARLWAAIDPIEFSKEVFDSCLEEQRLGPGSRRLEVLGVLTDEQVGSLWEQDGAARGLEPFPVAYYQRFGEAALRTVGEVITKEVSAQDGGPDSP